MDLIFSVESPRLPRAPTCTLSNKQITISHQGAWEAKFLVSSEVNEIYHGFLVIHLQESCGPIFTQLVCEQRHDVNSLEITLFQSHCVYSKTPQCWKVLYWMTASRIRSGVGRLDNWVLRHRIRFWSHCVCDPRPIF